MLGESAHASDDAVKSAAPKIKIKRRPYLSDNGPNTIMLIPNVKKKIVSVKPTRNSLAEKYSPIIGNAGRKRSVDNGIIIPMYARYAIIAEIVKYFCRLIKSPRKLKLTCVRIFAKV